MHTEQYDQGYIAGEAGARSSNNPYQHGTEDHHQWLAGWSAAQDDYYSELYKAEHINGTSVILMLVGIILACAFLLASVLGWISW